MISHACLDRGSTRVRQRRRHMNRHERERASRRRRAARRCIATNAVLAGRRDRSGSSRGGPGRPAMPIFPADASTARGAGRAAGTRCRRSSATACPSGVATTNAAGVGELLVASSQVYLKPAASRQRLDRRPRRRSGSASPFRAGAAVAVDVRLLLRRRHHRRLARVEAHGHDLEVLAGAERRARSARWRAPFSTCVHSIGQS